MKNFAYECNFIGLLQEVLGALIPPPPPPHVMSSFSIPVEHFTLYLTKYWQIIVSNDQITCTSQHANSVVILVLTFVFKS